MLENESEKELAYLIHALNNADILEQDDEKDIAMDKILDVLEDGISYESLVPLVAPELIAKAFTLCANHILQEDDDHHFCNMSLDLLKLGCPEAEKTEEYKKLLARADLIASVAANTRLEGNSHNDSEDQYHILNLPSLLQAFANAKGQVVEGENFIATPVDLKETNSHSARFNSCVVIRPKDGEPVLAVGTECYPLIAVQKSLLALGLTRDLRQFF